MTPALWSRAAGWQVANARLCSTRNRRITRPSNNGMQLTKAARCAPFAFRSRGQSLRAAFAADPGCWTDHR